MTNEELTPERQKEIDDQAFELVEGFFDALEQMNAGTPEEALCAWTGFNSDVFSACEGFLEDTIAEAHPSDTAHNLQDRYLVNKILFGIWLARRKA